MADVLVTLVLDHHPDGNGYQVTVKSNKSGIVHQTPYTTLDEAKRYYFAVSDCLFQLNDVFGRYQPDVTDPIKQMILHNPEAH